MTTGAPESDVSALGGVMRADNAWTDDRIAVLKAMWAAGATATAIAERLGGLSRSAVLGKISRLRLRADASAAANQAPAAATTSPDLALLQRRRHNRKGARRSSPKPRRKKPRRRSGKSLLELTNDTCRWPNGEPGTRGFFFCGAPGADLEGGRPYCAHHARCAYSAAVNDDEADGDAFVVSVRNSPSITPPDSLRRYAWLSPVKHPTSRWR